MASSDRPYKGESEGLRFRPRDRIIMTGGFKFMELIGHLPNGHSTRLPANRYIDLAPLHGQSYMVAFEKVRRFPRDVVRRGISDVFHP